MSNVKANQIFNYYEIYSLNRGENRNNLLIQLRKKQREIKKKLSAGALNESIMKDLMEQDDLIARAIRDFKTDERFEKYNSELDEAINNGTINVRVEQEAKDALERIERLFVKGAYEKVINLSVEALQQYGAQAKIYNYLVQSYLFVDRDEQAYDTVKNYIEAFPHDEHALNLGVRYAVRIKGDLDAAQNYLNKLLEIHSDLIITKVDEIFMFLARNDVENAFQHIDTLIKRNSSPQIAKMVAADLIGFANTLYREGEYDGVRYSYLMSSDDYKYCKQLSKKAYEICEDEDVKQFYKYTIDMGKTEFNEDNLQNLIVNFGGTILAGLGLFACYDLTRGLHDRYVYMSVPCLWFSVFLLATIFLFCKSKRPYWAIYKYYVTGEREPGEKAAIWFGKIFACYIVASFGIVKWIFRLMGMLFRW